VKLSQSQLSDSKLKLLCPLDQSIRFGADPLTKRYLDDAQFWAIALSGISCYHSIDTHREQATEYKESNG